MAKQTKKSKPTKAGSQAPEVIIDIDPPELASPSQGDFNRVRDLLRQRPRSSWILRSAMWPTRRRN
jgi:hypothetical protein